MLKTSGYASSLKPALLIVILIIGIVSRLPQLYGPNLLLDGDECIVGLMAKHITEGKPVTVYFYGQKYGLAYFEALVGAISFKLFGYGAFQLKAAMLAIWLGALVFFYLTAVKLLGVWQGFLLTLLFTVFPAWAVWSLKARGGYLTSFLLSSGLLYVFVKRTKDFSALAWFFIGITIGFIFYAQAFWLAGLFPFILYHFFNYSKKANLIWAVLGVLLVFSAFHLFGTSTSTFWNPKIISLNKNLLKPLRELPDRVFWHFTGSYYLDKMIKIGLTLRVTVILAEVLILAGIALQLYRGWRLLDAKRMRRSSDFLLVQVGKQQNTVEYLLEKVGKTSAQEHPSILNTLFKVGFRERQYFKEQLLASNTAIRKVAAKVLFLNGKPEGYLFFLSVCATLGYCLVLNELYYGYRYLLPLSGFVFLWLGVEINLLDRLKIVSGKIILIVVILLFSTEAIAMYGFKNFNFLATMQPVKPTEGTEEERLGDVFDYLKARNIKHVFSMDQLLEWFPVFYSGENVICRALPPIDRYPAYPQLVNKALAEGKPTAFIGYYPPPLGVISALNHPEEIKRIGFWYYIYPNPDFNELVRLGVYKVNGKPADQEFINDIIKRNLEIKAMLQQEDAD